MAANISELVGNTPILELVRAKEKYGLYANVFAKLLFEAVMLCLQGKVL